MRRIAGWIPRGFGAFLVLLAAWELAVWAFAIRDYMLPAPSAIAQELVRRWPRIWDGARITGLEIVLGYAIAISVSVPLALGIAFSRWMERNVYPLIVAFQV
ncbi:MAG: ABC transporter permease, partial [Alphaproteobacteria bacterium]